MALCSVWLLACSCGKKSPESALPPNTAGANQTAEGAPSEYARPVASPVAVQPVAVSADASDALAVLTQAVRKYSAERRQVPKNLDEIVRAGYLQNLPAAPPGKKFVLDTKRLEVTLAHN